MEAFSTKLGVATNASFEKMKIYIDVYGRSIYICFLNENIKVDYMKRSSIFTEKRNFKIAWKVKELEDSLKNLRCKICWLFFNMLCSRSLSWHACNVCFLLQKHFFALDHTTMGIVYFGQSLSRHKRWKWEKDVLSLQNSQTVDIRCRWEIVSNMTDKWM